ncbi:MAG: class I SAM-dependent methyltransferase [bacterium]|nr:class I SAM-dependent methyltransferase [bacterium]
MKELIIIKVPSISFSEQKYFIEEHRTPEHPEHGKWDALHEHIRFAKEEMGFKFYSENFWNDVIEKSELSWHSKAGRLAHGFKDYLAVRRSISAYGVSTYNRYQHRYETLEVLRQLVPLKYNNSNWIGCNFFTRLDTLNAVKEFCEVLDEPRVLEAGCGFGGNMFLLHRLLPKTAIYGFEYTYSRIASCIVNLVTTPMLEHLFLADVVSLDLEDKSYDVVFSHHVLEQLGQEKANKALKEMWRVSRRGIVCCEPSIQGCSNIYETWRMKKLGYCRDLLHMVKNLPNCKIRKFQQSTYREWPNSSYVIVLEKTGE